MAGFPKLSHVKPPVLIDIQCHQTPSNMGSLPCNAEETLILHSNFKW